MGSLFDSIFRFISKNLSGLKDKVVEEFDVGQMSEFLEGHHPVDVTESELLQILLDWLIQFASGSSQDYSNLASVLLRKIRWNEIRYDDILKVISSGMAILTQYLDS